MTDSVLTSTPVRLSSTIVEDKTDAFRRAARHSAQVRLMRRSIWIGAVLLAGGIAVFAIFDPLRAALPTGASIDGAGLSGSKITMQHPTMSGFKKNGAPYDFKAETAVQDLKQPTVLQLNKLDAHVGMADGTAHIRADVGLYDTTKEIMDLTGEIHITSTTGADIRMKSAHIEFNGGNVSSTEPVSVTMPSGTVLADTLRMTGNGADVTFEGHVHSTITPAAAGSPPTGSRP